MLGFATRIRRWLAYADAAFVDLALGVPLQTSIERLVSTLVSLHARSPGLHSVLFEEASRLKVVRQRAEAIHGWVTQPSSAPAEPSVFQREIVRLVLGYVKR